MGWRIYLLGDVRLLSGEREITHFESRKVAQLLARVALHPARIHPREELAALFWPEADRTTGLERLRHVLSSLQRQLASPSAPPEPFLIIERQSVRLNRSAVWCDATEFEAAVRAHRLTDAAALYKGELLPGDYDDWVQDERERLQALYEQADLPPPPPAQAVQPASDIAVSPAAAPPPVSPSSPGLPSYLTTFFGRDAERARLRDLLQTRRLVTLLGMGGTGKTRLAVEVGRGMPTARVVWVPLADCVDPALITHRLRLALGLSASGDLFDQIATTLGNQETLVILDNLEQMTVNGAAEAVEALLAALPNVRCLATSRALLHVPGEQSFPLSPLPLPQDGEVPVQEVAASPGIALFVDRARNSRPDFTITDRNRQDVIDICRMLDGIPLALELVAARIRTLTPAQMRQQLQDGQRFTLAARPDAAQRKDPRHGSLRGAVLWSWRLLTPRQQDFLTRVSVLRGRWSLETAQAVADAPDAPMLLDDLTAVSLVETQTAFVGEEEVTYFRLSETIREFADEQLSANERARIHHAHALQILAIADAPETLDLLLFEDTSRLVGAVEDALADSHTDDALRLCVALRNAFIASGATGTALDLTQRALALDSGSLEERIKAFVAGIDYALVAIDLPLAEQFVHDGREAAGDDPALRVAIRSAEILVMYLRGDPVDHTRAIAEQALEQAIQTQQPRLQANLHTVLGMLSSRAGNREQAQEHYAQAEALAIALGRASVVSQLRFKQAILASDSGDFVRSAQLYRQCLAAARRINDRESEAQILTNMGAILGQQQRWPEAFSAMQDGLRAAFAIGSSHTVNIGLWNIAEPLAYLGQGTAAVAVLTWAEHYWTTHSGPLDDNDIEYYKRVTEQAQSSLSAPMKEPSALPGKETPLREMVVFALSL